MEAGAIIFRTKFAAVAEGDFSLMQENRLKLTYLPRDTDIIIGDTVLTSGAGEYFEGSGDRHDRTGQTEKNGISEFAVLRPAADLEAVSQLFVIKSFEIEE
jgi:rod shape-determining protein MreC